MPGAVPYTSTYALTNATLPYILRLANNGWTVALGADPGLAAGLSTYNGLLTNRQVARSRTSPPSCPDGCREGPPPGESTQTGTDRAAGDRTGGWVLVFFGDVENYTWANVVVLVYLASALRFLDDERARLWPAAAALATGALFHLETLVLGPSLLVLAAVAATRGRRGEAVAAVLLVPGVLAAALGWFDIHGLPVADLFTHSQISAQGGTGHGSSPPPTPTTSGTGYPARAPARRRGVAAGVARRPRFRGKPRTVFLSAAAAQEDALLGLLWRARLDQVGDWDLYAVAAQPLALLVVTWLTAGPQLRPARHGWPCCSCSPRPAPRPGSPRTTPRPPSARRWPADRRLAYAAAVAFPP